MPTFDGVKKGETAYSELVTNISYNGRKSLARPEGGIDYAEKVKEINSAYARRVTRTDAGNGLRIRQE